MKIPRSSDPPLTLNPTALESLLGGKATLPKSTLLESSFNKAPLPMNNEAPEMFTARSEPRNRAVVPSIDGSSTPDTEVRLRLMVALPKTTSVAVWV